MWGRDPILPEAGFDRLRRALLGSGFLQRAVPFAECVDNRFAKEPQLCLCDPAGNKTNANQPNGRTPFEKLALPSSLRGAHEPPCNVWISYGSILALAAVLNNGKKVPISVGQRY